MKKPKSTAKEPDKSAQAEPSGLKPKHDFSGDLTHHKKAEAQPDAKKKSKSRSVTKEWAKGGDSKWTFNPETIEDDESAHYEKSSAQKHKADTKQNLMRASNRDTLLRRVDAYGTVIETGARFTVRLDNGDFYFCKTYRNTVTENPSSTLVAIGDRIGLKIMSAPATDEAGVFHFGEGLITLVVERRAKLSRTDIHSSESEPLEHILAANVDQLVIIASAINPPVRRKLIDRYLVAAELSKLPPLIVVNKVDLVGLKDAQSEVSIYTELGYRTVFVSAETGVGIEELRTALAEKISVFSGHSGVGKSTLINRLLGTSQLVTGELSQKNLKGSHTTSNAVMLALGDKAYLIDTPGIREFGLWNVTAETLELGFIEFAKYIPDCGYTCTHTGESECAVLAAAERGDIDPERFESYVSLFLALGADE